MGSSAATTTRKNMRSRPPLSLNCRPGNAHRVGRFGLVGFRGELLAHFPGLALVGPICGQVLSAAKSWATDWVRQAKRVRCPSCA
jgi:hypothetical protein